MGRKGLRMIKDRLFVGEAGLTERCSSMNGWARHRWIDDRSQCLCPGGGGRISTGLTLLIHIL